MICSLRVEEEEDVEVKGVKVAQRPMGRMVW